MAALFRITAPRHRCLGASSVRTYFIPSHHHLAVSPCPRSFSSIRYQTSNSERTLLKTAGLPCSAPSLRALQNGRGGNPRREERLRRQDGVPEEFRLVYAAPNEWYVRGAAGAMVASLVSVVPAMVLHPVTTLFSASPQLLTGAGLYTLLAAAVLLLAQRYPFRMYHSARRREFRVILTGSLLVNSRHIVLAEGSVKKVENASNILPWKDVLYTSRREKLVLLDSAFQSSEMYNRLLGYHHDETEDDGSRGA